MPFKCGSIEKLQREMKSCKYILTIGLQRNFLQLIMLIMSAVISSCTSTRVLTTGELSYVSKNHSYAVHGERFNYLIKDATISDRVLSGRIAERSQGHTYDMGNRIHLYLKSDSDIQIEKGEFIKIPIDRVTKAEEKEVYGVGAFVAAGAILILVGFTYFLLSFNLIF